MGATDSSEVRWLQIDFMKRRTLWFAISGVVARGQRRLARACAGLNLGIDFKGGVQITFKTAKPTSLSLVRDQTKAIGAATPSSRAAARPIGERELQELPDPAEEAVRRRSRTG